MEFAIAPRGLRARESSRSGYQDIAGALAAPFVYRANSFLSSLLSHCALVSYEPELLPCLKLPTQSFFYTSRTLHLTLHNFIHHN